MRTAFRFVASCETILPCSANELAELTEQGQLIPSLDVFLWSLALARVRHYGNDFLFFERLARITGATELAALQLTRDGEDCKRFIKFDEDYATLLDIDDTQGTITRSKRISQGCKLTRVNTFGAIQVALGDLSRDLFSDYYHGRFEIATVSLKHGITKA